MKDILVGDRDLFFQVVELRIAENHPPLTPQSIGIGMSERNAVDILRRQMDASVLLIKALGGGRNVSQLPQVSSLH
jgi:hypothetical protein